LKGVALAGAIAGAGICGVPGTAMKMGWPSGPMVGVGNTLALGPA